MLAALCARGRGCADVSDVSESCHFLGATLNFPFDDSEGIRSRMRCLCGASALLLAPSSSALPLNASLLDAVLLSPDFPYPVSGFLLGVASGPLYSRALGGFDMAGGVSVASASKWISQLVFSLLLTEGNLSLADTTGSLLAAPWGGLPASDPRRNISLGSLQSFTSGLNETELSAPCAAQGGVPGSTPSSCASDLWHASSPLPFPATASCPSTFFYAGSHQMLAGYMAVAAARASGWNALFASRLARPLGLAAATTFYTPLSNPHPGGGLYISAADYGKVLTAYFAGSLLPAAAVAVLEADYTPEPPTCIAYAPLAPALHWHYGLGHWLECRAEGSYGAAGSWQPACSALCEHSSIGKLGAYPFIDRCAGFWALVMVANGSAAQSAVLGEKLWPAARAALAASPSVSTSPSRAGSSAAASPSRSRTPSASLTPAASSAAAGSIGAAASVSGTPSAANSAAGDNSKLGTGIAVGVGAGGTLLLAVALLLFCHCKRAAAKKAITIQPAGALRDGGAREMVKSNPLSVIHSRCSSTV